MSHYEIRPAERRDLAALSALAASQAAARRSLDPRLAASPHIIPFLSQAETLDDVLSWRHHVTLVARQDGQVVGGINLHRVEQSDRDPFAAYYPQRFTSIGLIATHSDAPSGVLAGLLAGAREQADRWRTPALLAHNATADCAMREALAAFGFRIFYHYALRPPSPDSGVPAPLSETAAAGHDANTTAPLRPEPDTIAPMPSTDTSAAARVSPGHNPEPDLIAPVPAPDTSAIAALNYHREPDAIAPMPSPDTSAPALPRKPELDGLSVRHASSADLNDIVRLGIESVKYHAALDHAMHVPRGEDGKMRRRFQAILHEPQHGALLVALLDWQIVGFYSLYLQSIDESWTPPLFSPGRYGLLAEVAVAGGLRGRGIGRRLFYAVEHWFRERGAQRLWLIYLPRNPLSSRFWPALGFQPVWDVMLAGA